MAVDYVRDKINGCCRATYAFCIKSSPPEPCEEVMELFDQLEMPKNAQHMMYLVFHELKQGTEEDVVEVATEIERSSVAELIFTRRRWCEHILEQIISFGGIEDEDPICWDDFLYILLQFCSCSKVELCQCLFLVIVGHVKSNTSNYLTMEQLVEFYSMYNKCPVTSFNTRAIDFTRLPLRRYYVEDFTELIQRFTPLLNPMIHLQRSLQEFMPSISYWDNHHRTEVICRKITLDFFKMEKTRCYLWGEPPFRESCEMLAPEALGFIAANEAQWKMRTFDLHERTGALTDTGATSKDGKLVAPPGFQYRSLRQFSVWGEQPNPEETEKAMFLGGDDVHMTATGHITTKVDEKEMQAKTGETGEDALPPGSPRAGGPDSPKEGESKKDKKGDKSAAMQASVVGKAQIIDPTANPAALCHLAACTDEELNPPIELLPPKWMKGCSIAPAPRGVYPDRPLPVEEQDLNVTSPSAWGTTGSFNTGISPPAPPPPPSAMASTNRPTSKKGKSQVSFSV